MNIVQRIRAWLVFGRMHTAILETPIAILGAALGLGTLWNLEILKWVLFGIIYHAAGYSMNSYVDWKKGFDKKDPRKQHHPLNTGEIQPKTAKLVVYLLLVLLAIYGLWASNFSVDAAIVLVAMYISGITYNLYGKYISLKFLPISIVHTLVFVLPYITYSNTINLSAVLIVIAIFIHHIFQIGISGEIKDIDQDEANLLRNMGTKIYRSENLDTVIDYSNKVYKMAMVLTVLEILLIVLALPLYLSENDFGVLMLYSSMLPLVFTSVWLIGESQQLIQSGLFDRDKRVSTMSRRELAGLWLILSAAIPVITLIGWVVIVAASIVYLLSLSKFMWGNWVRPEV